MGSLLRILKVIIPASVRPGLLGLFYGWHGNYSDWKEAADKSQGYNSGEILLKSIESAEKVRGGKGLFERDTVLFEKPFYSYPLLSCLLTVAAGNKGRLSVMDFGGSFGSVYYQHKTFLDRLGFLQWCVVEQENIVKAGIERFTTEKLRFFFTIEECLKSVKADVILLSSVLQYLEEPETLIAKLKSCGIRYIIIDRTPFIAGRKRLTIQKVPPWIYKASYPCWFFNKEELINLFLTDYELISEFEAIDKANIKSEFKGFFLKLKGCTDNSIDQ